MTGGDAAGTPVSISVSALRIPSERILQRSRVAASCISRQSLCILCGEGAKIQEDGERGGLTNSGSLPFPHVCGLEKGRVCRSSGEELLKQAGQSGRAEA